MGRSRDPASSTDPLSCTRVGERRANALMARLARAATHVAASLLAALAAGCGAAAKRVAADPAVKYIHSYTLAHQVLPEGAVTIVGVLYRFGGHTQFALRTQIEEDTPRGVSRSPGGGRSMRPDEYGAVLMTLETQCIGRQRDRFAYGLLRDPADTIVAQSAGTNSTLHRASIPAALQTRGVVIYRLLRGSGPVTFITRAPDGGLVARERFGPIVSAGTCSG